MKIVNLTAYPNRRVNSILRKVAKYLEVEPRKITLLYAPPVGVSFGLATGEAFSFLGGPYMGFYCFSGPPRGEITLCLRYEQEYPMKAWEERRSRSTPPWGDSEIENWEQALVAIAAHEMYHQRQHEQFDEPEEEMGPLYAEFRLWRDWVQGKL